MRRESFILGWMLVSAAACASDAPAAGKDWTCVPTADGKAWDCGYGRDKPEQRYLATPSAAAPTGPSTQGAPLGFADPGKSGPVGIAPVPATPVRRPAAPTTPAASRAPAAAPVTVQSPQLRPVKPPQAVVAAPAVKPPTAPAVAARPGRGPAKEYTIQVIGLSRDAGIETIAARLGSSGLALFRLTTERAGTPWFVLTAGEFDNAAAARAAIAKLPQDLIQSGAFPRQVSTLAGSWR